MAFQKQNYLAQLFFLLAIVLPCSPNAFANTDTPHAPPWLMASRHFNLIMFQADAATVEPLVPPGVQLKVNPHGKVTLVLEAYEAERAFGTTPFQKAFIAVQIENHPTSSGDPAHFALWGTVANENVLHQFKHTYNFPYDLAQSINLDEQQGAHHGVIKAADNSRIRFQVQPLADQPFAREGVVNMVGKLPDDRLVVGEVPYLARGYVGKLVELEVDPQGNPVLAMLKTAQPVWSMVSVDLTFSYANRTPVSPAVAMAE